MLVDGVGLGLLLPPVDDKVDNLEHDEADEMIDGEDPDRKLLGRLNFLLELPRFNPADPPLGLTR